MSDGSKSCQEFCAYHSTYNKGSTTIQYGIMPDQGGACASGCGPSSNALDNLTMVSSHELIEAVTDPQVGLATTDGPPLGWYDSNNGEIGDICVTGDSVEQGSTTSHGNTHAVQTEWSNKQGKCADHGSGSCTPSCSGKVCGSDGCGGSCGTCSGGKTCNASGQCTSSCTPSCSGKTCGDDGCGGSCGTCSTGQTCSSAGTCTGGTTNSCAHDKCTAGTKLASGCNSCVTKVCAKDSYCCGTKWDAQCVREVGTYCGSSNACH
jgi:hypothetical protein